MISVLYQATKEPSWQIQARAVFHQTEHCELRSIENECKQVCKYLFVKNRTKISGRLFGHLGKIGPVPDQVHQQMKIFQLEGRRRFAAEFFKVFIKMRRVVIIEQRGNEG